MTDIIDTRDLHDRYNELQEKIQENEAEIMSPADILDEDELSDWEDLSDMEDSISDFWHGETLVNDDYFTEYAQQLAEDLGYTGRNVEGQSWPFNHIDWEAAASDLLQDYTEFQWQGETYQARA